MGRVWAYWKTGWDNIPPIIDLCRQSWIKHSIDVTYLDDSNINEYLDDIPSNIKNTTVQAYSDYIRVNLLAKYGGVWLDATIFLNEDFTWLKNYYEPEKFFVFQKPSKSEILLSSFIASSSDNKIIQEWKKRIDTYWKNRTEPHTYFWVHHLFEFVLEENFKDSWNRVPLFEVPSPSRFDDWSFYAGNPMYFSRFKRPSKSQDLFGEHKLIKKGIEDNALAPLYKLCRVTCDPAANEDVFKLLINKR